MPVLALVETSNIPLEQSGTNARLSPTTLSSSSMRISIFSLKTLPLLTTLLGMGSLFSACTSQKEDTIELTNECMVTRVQLGNMTRTVRLRTADGLRDSVAVITVPGSLYAMTIDQQTNTIYNVDSLPYNTKVSRVAFATFSTIGTPAIRSLVSEKDSLFTTTDSTDLRRPRLITVYSLDGATKRTYTLELRVHQEQGDSTTWKQLTTAEWDAQDFPAATNVFAGSNLHFKVEGGQILRSADGTNWTADALEGANANQLPNANLAGIVLPTRSDKSIEEAILYGTLNGESRIWKRNIDLNGTYDFEWSFLPAGDGNPYSAPVLSQAKLLPYDDGVLLLGLDAQQKIQMRYSLDRGRTWKQHDFFKLPAALPKTANRLAANVDANNNLWLRIDESIVWRGRLNRLGWKTIQSIFLKSGIQ